MTFSGKIKKEISNLECTKLEYISELSGIIRTSADIKLYAIRIQTENINVANRIFKIVKEIYNVTSNITIKKNYHLEFLIENLEFAEFLNNLVNEYNLNSKVHRRKKGYMVYIKESEKISELLTIIKAYEEVLYYEDIRTYREKVNMTNRINNCEQANIEKSMKSAQSQVDDINYLKEIDAYDLLDDKVKEVANYRLKYPESSLIELSEIISIETGNKVTKSCINHRLRKIRELVRKAKENSN